MIRLWSQKKWFMWVPHLERRHAQRISLHETLYLDVKTPDTDQNFAAEGKNISESGVLLAAETCPPEGARVRLGFHFYPAYGLKEQLELRARVVHWSRQSSQIHYRIGLEFENPDESSKRKIRAFIWWLKEWDKHHLH